MDRKAAIAIVAAMPLLAAAFYGFTRILPPFWGYFAALAFYWFAILVPLIMWRGGFAKIRRDVLWPSQIVAALSIVMVIGVAIAAALRLAETPLPLWIAGVMVVAALTNGTLEEYFWRGTVLQDGASRAEQGGQLLLFTGWHLALLVATGVTVTGGPALLLLGAAGGGFLWTISRMQTGSIGFGVAAHIGLNVFAFIELAALNQ